MSRSVVFPILLVVLLLVAPAAPARQQDDRLELLQRQARRFSRHGLVPDIRFLGPDGGVRSGVRCATRTMSEAERRILAEETTRVPRRTDATAEPVTVPVVFHVVRTRRGKWDVPRGRILEQMKVLNRSFAERGFRFELQEIRRYRHSRFARRCLDRRVERGFKRRHAVEPARSLNVYTCRPADGILGYAWFPSDWDEDSFMHGVVLLHSTLPGGGAAPYDQGDTLVHEVGHWAGLHHTFSGGCEGRGDRVGDTPAQASPTFGCPARRDSCPARAGDDPIDNFMDYSDDACMMEFTPGQQRRMSRLTGRFRPSLDASAGSG